MLSKEIPVIRPNTKSIEEKAVFKETMSEVHWDTNDQEVKKFTEDKSKVVDVVLVMNIVLEKLKG